jgi:hypothetical protein
MLLIKGDDRQANAIDGNTRAELNIVKNAARTQA